jgi:hypothetical protein
MLSSTYHDEKLVSIAVVDNSLTIEISSKDKKVRIKVTELEKLRITDFKEGNIINLAQVIHAGVSTDTESMVRLLLKYAYEVNDADLKRNAKLSSFLDNKIKEHQEGSIVILEIEPSYGAYLIAIGRQIVEEQSII